YKILYTSINHDQKMETNQGLIK
ncbi:MAG: hypothetical protein K0R19_1911, partial [Bacillota bacterium]|nr:hypothetical protein [Bacillota bacterium]